MRTSIPIFTNIQFFIPKYSGEKFDTISALIERVSIECRKSKTKVITLTNQNERRQSSKPIKTRSNYT